MKYDVNTDDPKTNYTNLIKGLFEASREKGMMDQFWTVVRENNMLEGVPRLAVMTAEVHVNIEGRHLSEEARREILVLRGFDPEKSFPSVDMLLPFTVVFEVPENQRYEGTPHRCFVDDYERNRAFLRALRGRRDDAGISNDMYLSVKTGGDTTIRCTECQ